MILKHLNSKWSTTRSLKDLLKVIKDNVKGQILPCQKQPEDSKHRYHSAGTVDKFRLRCQVCKHTLWEPEARSYFAFLILEGAVPHLAIDLPSLPIPPETSQAVSKRNFKALNMMFMSWSNLGVCSTGREVENERETRVDDRKKQGAETGSGSYRWISPIDGTKSNG